MKGCQLCLVVSGTLVVESLLPYPETFRKSRKRMEHKLSHNWNVGSEIILQNRTSNWENFLPPVIRFVGCGMKFGNSSQKTKPFCTISPTQLMRTFAKSTRGSFGVNYLCIATTLHQPHSPGLPFVEPQNRSVAVGFLVTRQHFIFGAVKPLSKQKA